MPRHAGAHVALAIGIGTVGPVFVGMLHSLLMTSVVRPVWFFALFALPVIVALAAFIVALVTSTLLARVLKSSAARWIGQSEHRKTLHLVTAHA